MKAVRPVIGSNGVPYLQMRPVGSQSMSGREERNDHGSFIIINCSKTLFGTLW
jgi:hypothetical protein